MVVKEKKTILNLGYAQLWTAATVIAGLLGTLYAAGIKTETEIKKFELMKQAQKYEDQIAEIKTISREFEADAIFFKSQYIKTHARLSVCMKEDISKYPLEKLTSPFLAKVKTSSTEETSVKFNEKEIIPVLKLQRKKK